MATTKAFWRSDWRLNGSVIGLIGLSTGTFSQATISTNRQAQLIINKLM